MAEVSGAYIEMSNAFSLPLLLAHVLCLRVNLSLQSSASSSSFSTTRVSETVECRSSLLAASLCMCRVPKPPPQSASPRLLHKPWSQLVFVSRYLLVNRALERNFKRLSFLPQRPPPYSTTRPVLLPFQLMHSPRFTIVCSYYNCLRAIKSVQSTFSMLL